MSREEPYVPPGERDAILEEMRACDQEAESACAKNDHLNYLSALERGLHLRKKVYSETSHEVSQSCRTLCQACNRAATTMLHEDNLDGAINLLKRAEEVADRHELDRAVTWNNLACYYRRTGKLRAAVTYLERALAIEENAGGCDAAQTHLNLCATLSQLQRHSEALGHAQKALIRIYETLSRLMLSGKLKPPADGREVAEEQQEQVTVLCVAYHNLAVEQEYLKNIDSAASSYAEGVTWAVRFLPAGHQLHEVMRNSLKAVCDRLPQTSRTRKRIDAVLADIDHPVPADNRSESNGAERSGKSTHRSKASGSPPRSPGRSGKSTHRSRTSESSPRSPRSSRSSLPTSRSRGPPEQYLTPRA